MTCQICSLISTLNPKSTQGAALLCQLCRCRRTLGDHWREHPHPAGDYCPRFQFDAFASAHPVPESPVVAQAIAEAHALLRDQETPPC